MLDLVHAWHRVTGAVLDDHERPGFPWERAACRGEKAFERRRLDERIGRIDEEHAHGPSRDAGEGPLGVAGEEGDALAQVEAPRVGLDARERAASLFEERAVGSAARERLEGEAPGARKGVDHVGAFEVGEVAEHGKERFADAIAGWPRAIARRSVDASRTKEATRDAHGREVTDYALVVVALGQEPRYTHRMVPFRDASCAVGLAFAVAAFPRVAAAASLSTPVAVIAVESDDAEALAEGLTSSVERGIDKAAGWRKVHVRESLSTLGFAFKCPARPDSACLERIAQHLGVDLVVWGTMNRAAEGRFDASLHLWRRRGPGTDYTARIAVSKDPKSDAIVEANGSACAKNLLGPVRSTLVVQTSATGALMVRVDGLNRGNVVDGRARVDVEPGPHRVELTRGVDVVAGREVDVRGDEEVDLPLDAEAGKAPNSASPESSSAPAETSWKTYAGYGGLGVGSALGVVAIVEAVRFANARSELETQLALVPSSVSDVCTTDTVPNAVNACRSYNEAASARALGFVFGAVSVVMIGGGAAFLWQATHEAPQHQARLGFVPRSGGGQLTFTSPLD